jgi:pimeloyl-ACP methyl ester carboxylesterase
MKRREFILAASFLAASCATPMKMVSAQSFTSDRISVTSSGSGPDVVLIPGLTSSPEIWADTAAAIPGYRYHYVQVKGFAGVPAQGNASGPVIASAAAEIARYIGEAKLKSPALIGHSMGGTIGMEVAARHPDKVGKLMVVDMLPFLGLLFGPPGTTKESVVPTANAIRDALLASSEEARVRQIEANIATMVKTESLRALPIRHAIASDRDVGARAMHELITTDLRPELPNFKGPLSILYVKTPNVPLNEAQFDAVYKLSYASAPQATLRRIDNSYHFIMLDQPERFREEVRAFLR